MSDPIALEVYQQIAEEYADNVGSSPFNAFYERPAMFSLIGDVRDKHVLDVGCGSGDYAEYLLDNGASRVVGVDCSPKMLEIARSRLGGRVTLYQSDVEKGVYLTEESLFDVVICPLIFHYIQDWSTALTSLCALMKPTAPLIMSVGHPMSDFASSLSRNYFEVELIEEEWPSYGVQVPSYRRPLGEIFRALRATGFIVEELIEPTPVPQLADIDHALYEQLSREPNFLCVRCRKRNGDIE